MSSPKTITSLEFTAPIKTICELNAREHFFAKAKRKKAQRRETFYEWRRAAAGRTLALPCVVKLTRIAPKALDEGDNLNSSMKAVRDEIASLLGVDDGGSQVRWEYDQQPIGGRKYSVKVEVRSL